MISVLDHQHRNDPRHERRVVIAKHLGRAWPKTRSRSPRCNGALGPQASAAMPSQIVAAAMKLGPPPFLDMMAALPMAHPDCAAPLAALGGSACVIPAN